MGLPPGYPPGNLREARRNGLVLVLLFFPAGEGSCLVLETTSVDHGDIPTGFVRDSATGKVRNALPGAMVDVRK